MSSPNEANDERLEVVVLRGTAASVIAALPSILRGAGLSFQRQATSDGVEVKIFNTLSSNMAEDHSVGHVGSTSIGSSRSSAQESNIVGVQQVVGRGSGSQTDLVGSIEAPGGADKRDLAGELAKLLAELQAHADSSAKEEAVGAIASAQAAARNDADVTKHLKKAGSWALEVATKIGTEVAASAIRASAGIP